MINDNNADILEQENDFRKRYAQELRKKKETDKNSISPHFGLNELSEERARVKQQALITPGRRGEQIKNEEIDKEILRRLSLRIRTGTMPYRSDSSQLSHNDEAARA